MCDVSPPPEVLHACNAITNGSVCVSAEESWRRGRIVLLHVYQCSFPQRTQKFHKDDRSSLVFDPNTSEFEANFIFYDMD